MNVNELPSEILCRIFKTLHPRDWLLCEFVCKDWCEILRSFWREVVEVEYELCGYVRVTFQDNQSYQLTSSGDWDDDSALLIFVLERCGDHVQKLDLHIAQEWAAQISPEKILLIGASCKHLKKLSLNGYVSSVADSISVISHDLIELEEISIWDEAFVDESTNDVNSATLVGDIVSTCRALRVIHVMFFFIPPLSVETYRRMSHLEHIERIRCLFWTPLAPEYVETVLSSLTACGWTLRELNFGCKLKASLDGVACARSLTLLSEACPNLEILDLGFQLHAAIHEDNSDEVYYDPVDLAPWTFDVLSALSSFHDVRELSLRHFELSDESALEALKALCENVEILRIEDNYGVTGKLLWEVGKASRNMHSFSISQARLSHADLVELIQRCPNLSFLRLSNVDNMSFKLLVLNTHAALHHCGNPSDGQRGDDGVHQLNLKLNTARGYIHDEAEELKNVHLCGLTLLPPGHSNVVIDRVCRKLDSNGRS